MFNWNNDYKDLEQVAAWLPEFTAIRNAITDAGGYPYNDSFKGKIPGIAGDREDTAIYLLQGLFRQREMDARVAGWLADGYQPVTSLEVTTKYAHVILYQSDRGGQWHAYESARLVPEMRPAQAAITGGISALLPKGRRTNGILVSGYSVLVKS